MLAEINKILAHLSNSQKSRYAGAPQPIFSKRLANCRHFTLWLFSKRFSFETPETQIPQSVQFCDIF